MMDIIYKPLGEFIEEVSVKNKNEEDLPLLGVNMFNHFMPSVANVNGTDMSNYKVVLNGQFAFNPMHIGRDRCIPISLLEEYDKILISPAYTVFKIKDEKLLDKNYLMMILRTKEFDKHIWFMTDSSVRGSISFEDFCSIKIPYISLENQIEVEKNYSLIKKSIDLKKDIIKNCYAYVNNEFKKLFETKINSESDCNSVFKDFIEKDISGNWGSDSKTLIENKSVQCIRAADFNNILFSRKKEIPERFIKESTFNDCQLKEKNFVCEISGGTPTQSTGRIIMIPKSFSNKSFVCSNFCRAFQIKEGYEYYLYAYHNYLYENGIMFQYENGTTGIKNFDFDSYADEYNIYFPTESELFEFNQIVSSYFIMIDNYGSQLDDLYASLEILPRFSVNELYKGV